MTALKQYVVKMPPVKFQFSVGYTIHDNEFVQFRSLQRGRIGAHLADLISSKTKKPFLEVLLLCHSLSFLSVQKGYTYMLWHVVLQQN